MSKLEEKFKYVLDNPYRSETESYKNYQQEIAGICVEITEQECIGFAEWLDDNVDLIAEMESIKTYYNNKILFQLYQKSKENE